MVAERNDKDAGDGSKARWSDSAQRPSRRTGYLVVIREPRGRN